MGSPHTEHRGAYFLQRRHIFFSQDVAEDDEEFFFVFFKRCGNVVVPVEVFYAVDLWGGVYGEGDPVQTAVTHHTREAARVVGLPHGPQDAVQDGFGALGTTLQGTLKQHEAFEPQLQRRWRSSFLLTHNVTAFAVTLLIQGVERLPAETGVAGDACETLHVEHLLHGDTATAVADHIFSAAGAASWERGGTGG